MCNVEFPTKSTFAWTTTDIVSRYEDGENVVVKTANSTYIFNREVVISRSMLEELSKHCTRDEVMCDSFGRTIGREVDYMYNNVVATLRYFTGTDEYDVPCICDCPEVAWITIDGEKKYSIDDIDTLELLRLFSYLHNGENIENHLDEFGCVYVYATDSYVK